MQVVGKARGSKLQILESADFAHNEDGLLALWAVDETELLYYGAGNQLELDRELPVSPVVKVKRRRVPGCTIRYFH